MVRILIFIFASILLILGLITLPSPIPIGIILIGISLALFVMVSVTVQNWLRYLRTRYPGLNLWVLKAEKYLPSTLAKALKKSAPDKGSQSS